MNCRLVLFALLALLLIPAIAGACNDGAAPFLPTPTEGGLQNTPGAFETARDALSAQLEAIGVNIGVLPDDISQQLLDACRELEMFLDPGETDEICDAIEEAIDQRDPGLIDLVLERLDELEPK